MHAIGHGLQGFAQKEIPVPLARLQSLFVGVVMTLAPIIAAILLWTQFYRIDSWILLS
jgi:hypothetical protein